jgi:hypothetical protein
MACTVSYYIISQKHSGANRNMVSLFPHSTVSTHNKMFRHRTFYISGKIGRLDELHQFHGRGSCCVSTHWHDTIQHHTIPPTATSWAVSPNTQLYLITSTHCTWRLSSPHHYDRRRDGRRLNACCCSQSAVRHVPHISLHSIPLNITVLLTTFNEVL